MAGVSHYIQLFLSLSLFFLELHLICVSVCARARVCMHVCVPECLCDTVCVQVRGQHAGFSSLLLPSVFQGLS